MTKVHVGGLQNWVAVEGHCGEGVEAGEDEVYEFCFGRDGEFKAIDPGFGCNPLSGEFVGVEERVGNSLGRSGWLAFCV